MKKLVPTLVSVLALGLLTAGPTLAQERWHEHGWGHDHPRGYDWDHWRRGGWTNGWHEGRFGWWWVVNGVWFSYPAPVYPYPQPPVVVVTPPAQPQPGYFYYCPNPSGYYPAIPQCPTGWQMVPAQAQPAPVPAPAPVPMAPAPMAPPR